MSFDHLSLLFNLYLELHARYQGVLMVTQELKQKEGIIRRDQIDKILRSENLPEIFSDMHIVQMKDTQEYKLVLSQRNSVFNHDFYEVTHLGIY